MRKIADNPSRKDPNTKDTKDTKEVAQKDLVSKLSAR